MTFTARQVLTAAQLNDLSIDTLTTTGDVTVGGTLTATIGAAGSDGQVQYNNGGSFAGASSLYYDDANERVGIGTTSPDTKLHVQIGASAAPTSVPTSHMIIADSGETSDSGMAVYSSTTGNGYLRFGDSDYPAQGGFRYEHSADKMYFRTAGTDRGAIDSSGNVGIGTTSPARTLEVQSTSGAVANFESTASNAYITLTDSGTTSNTHVRVGAVGDDMRLFAGAAERVRIDSSGNVGINDSSPSYTLDVAGTVRATGALYSNSVLVSAATSSYDKLRVYNSSLYSIGMVSGITYGHLGDWAMTFRMNSDNNRGFWWGDTSHTAATGAMSLTTNGRLTVATSLSVGQGESITSPSTTTLYVNGAITSTGSITLDGDLTGTSNTNFFVGNDSNERMLFQESSNQIFFMTNGTYRWYISSSGDLLPYANKVDNIGASSLRVSYFYGDVINIDNEIQSGNGSASDPSYTFTSDGDTGVYRNTTNQLALTAGNSAGIIVASGTCITASPATTTTSGYQYVLRNNTFGTLYRFTSSADLKEKIATFDDSGSIIDALRPVTFVPRFIPGQPTPDDQDDEYDPTVETEAQRAMREADIQHGFIAEEVALVAGGTLAQYEWTDDGELRPTGWRWPDLIAVLTAEVKSLRARVASLESAP